MRSKKISAKSRFRKLNKEVKDLNLDLLALVDEYNWYNLGDIEKLPIESLYESLRYDKKLIRNKGSLRDFHHKFALKKLYDKKSDELEIQRHELNIAKIDIILEKLYGLEEINKKNF